jgi:putative PIG3 family NAD(P)H quinone oxidoreductase
VKAIRVHDDVAGRPLIWADVPDPSCGPGEVLVDIYAAAVNRADVAQRAGHYPPPPGASDILGLDMAGIIREVGAEVTGWQPGDRVCALLGGGGYAEQVAVPAGMLMPMPEGWSFVEAACLPEVYLTAFVNIFMEAGFQPGETVLVHGGASGVGTAAIQLVHQAGGKVLATAGSAAKVEACRELGADLAVNYRTEDFVAQVQANTEGAGVDIILDMVGADYLAGNLELLRLRGRLVIIATQSGARAEINLAALMGRRLRIIGSVLRARSLAEKIAIKEQFLARFAPLLASGAIRPVIDRVYPIQDAEAAHRRMAANENIGKLVLQVRAA